MFKRLLTLLITFPAALALVVLIVANRHNVTMVLDPFNPQDPGIVLPAPFYAFLVGAMLVGVMLGGFATWMSQGKWRQTARRRTQEAMRYQAEAERLSRERDAQVTASKQLLTAE
ncbi:MAG: lipopolysaccharide assembly protein LapA domain-containing protein [Pseudomonadota bacterium]